MSNYLAKGVTWDLSDLYPSIEDAKVSSDLKTAEAKAVAFEKKYKASFEKPDQNGVLPLPALLKDYKEIAVLLTKLGAYSHLSFAEKTDDPTRGAFMQKIQVALTDVQSHLVFFEVYWNKLDDKTASRLMKDPLLKTDLHFLEKMRAYAPHTLLEGEEKIMAVKSNTSSHAFSRLFDETMNNIPFYIEIGGKRVKKTEGEVLSLFHSTERSQRKMASESLAEGLKTNSRLLCYIYKIILADHRSNLKIRRFRHPMDPMNLSNEIDLESVLNLIKSVKAA